MFLTEFFSENGGAVESPHDPRDYKAENILGTTKKEIPESVMLPLNGIDTPVQNQGGSYKCTSYAVTKAFEIMNTEEHYKPIDFNPDEQWDNQTEYPATNNPRVGDYTRSALEALKRFGLQFEGRMYHIEGYASIDKTEQSIKEWISRGHPLFMSCDTTQDSRGWNTWTYAKKTGFAGIGIGTRLGGHAFVGKGYDNEGIICENSYGKGWGIKKDIPRLGGTFKIRWSDIGKLHTIYIIYDKKDYKYIYKDVSEMSPHYEIIKWAQKNKLVQGYPDGTFRPDQPITRAEILHLIKRLNLK